MAKDAEKSRESNPKPAGDNKPEPRKTDEDPVGKVYDSRLIRRLGHYLLPYWWQATVSSLSVSLKSLSDVAGPYLVMVGIDRYFPTGPARQRPALLQPLRTWLHQLAHPPPACRSRAAASPSWPPFILGRADFPPTSSNSFRPT